MKVIPRMTFFCFPGLMILILSDVNMDETTNLVIDWLDHHKADYIRLNGLDLVNQSKFSLAINDDQLNIENDDFTFPDVDDIEIVWFRKWLSDELSNNVNFPEDSDWQLKCSTAEHLSSEQYGVSKYLFNTLRDKKWLTKPATLRKYNHKMDQLMIAKQVGLEIPATIVTNQRVELGKFISTHGKVICKSITDAEVFLYNDNMYVPYTITLSSSDLHEVPKQFFPSLFQEALDKDFEIRTFFLNGEMYSMAMFTQSSEGTKSDFRKYNYSRPTRSVPFKLPESISQKIAAFMALFDLNCGSVDLIRTKDGKYYFLEVNPTGQFGMVSYPCNYNLEEKVACALINHN